MYVLIRAARYLGVEPWELEARSKRWVAWAIVCQNAEVWAKNEMASAK